MLTRRTAALSEPLSELRSPGGSLRPPERRRRHAWRRRLAWAGLVIAVLLVPVAISLGRALTRPGNDSFSERIAEWARDHHAGALVTWMEQATYQPPKVGGQLPPTSPLNASAAPSATSAGPPPIGLPATIPAIATPALAGEGVWHVQDTVHGRPALAAAYLRPDALHTSYTSMVAWLNPNLIRAVWHPGTTEPGGRNWSGHTYLAGGDRTNLVAAFNSAFRLADSAGGFYDQGKTLGHLRTGAASLVVDRQGHIDVGAWGTEVTMQPTTATVRQNLALIVDNGKVAAGIGSNAGHRWGATVGNAYYVWRSGIGVTASGAVVFVAGNRLSAASLANLLVRAGAVRAMELDINRDWTSFVLYRTPHGALAEKNALPDMWRAANRYDTPSSRDFFALYTRP